MAKEKTDATSLFSAMNKNRVKTTKEVKKTKTNDNNDLNDQNAQDQEISEKTAGDSKDDKESKEKKTTTLVNELFENRSNITEVIEKEKENPDEQSEDKTGSVATAADNTADSDGHGAFAEPLDNDEIREEKKDKELQHIHIALPKDVFDKLEIAKKAYYNNKTTYIRNLILDDYEKNKDYYDRLPNIR